MLNFYLVCLFTSSIYFVNGDDDLSGSGFDEDPMKIAKTQSGKYSQLTYFKRGLKHIDNKLLKCREITARR